MPPEVWKFWITIEVDQWKWLHFILNFATDCSVVIEES